MQRAHAGPVLSRPDQNRGFAKVSQERQLVGRQREPRSAAALQGDGLYSHSRFLRGGGTEEEDMGAAVSPTADRWTRAAPTSNFETLSLECPTKT